MHREACVAGTGLVTSGMAVLAQALPGVPDDFKSWPITAIIGFLALASLALAAYAMRCMMNAATQANATAVQQAATLSTVSQQLSETNDKIGSLVSTQEHTNQVMIATNAELRARPCMIAEE